MNRRKFLSSIAAATLSASALKAEPATFKLNYITSAAMYGYDPLADILPEIKKTGTDFFDIWPKPHGNQREQLTEMGVEKFKELTAAHGVKLGAITRYDIGPFKLQDEFKLAASLGVKVIVCGGGRGPQVSRFDVWKEAFNVFGEKMKPVVAQAEESGVTLAIENHRSTLIAHPDAIRLFRDTVKSPRIGLAFAPHHLPKDPMQQSALIEELGSKVAFFYAQQGTVEKKIPLTLEEELLQMPGSGPLDFAPLIGSLKKIQFAGFTEIFMHPVPRGRKIVETTQGVTDLINKSRTYLDTLATK
jgi:sugar phosphate isomerase/epimerase